MKRFIASICAGCIVLFARGITAVRGIWKGVAPASTRRVYFANHTSNGDFILLWAAIPARVRHQSNWVQMWLKSRESSAHLVDCIMLRACCDASGAFRAFFV